MRRERTVAVDAAGGPDQLPHDFDTAAIIGRGSDGQPHSRTQERLTSGRDGLMNGYVEGLDGADFESRGLRPADSDATPEKLILIEAAPGTSAPRTLSRVGRACIRVSRLCGARAAFD
jgi:hypothetical protein